MVTWPTRLHPQELRILRILAASGSSLPGATFASPFVVLPCVPQSALRALIREHYIAPSQMSDHTWALTWRGRARLEEES